MTDLSGFGKVEPDFILDDVRNRLLTFVREKTMNDQGFRVDVAAVLMIDPRTGRPQIQLAIMISCASPILGERIMVSVVAQQVELKDVLLQGFAEQLVNGLIEQKARIMSDRGGN